MRARLFLAALAASVAFPAFAATTSITPPGMPPWTLISTQTLGSATNFIDFTSLTQTYKDLRIVASFTCTLAQQPAIYVSFDGTTFPTSFNFATVAATAQWGTFTFYDYSNATGGIFTGAGDVVANNTHAPTSTGAFAAAQVPVKGFRLACNNGGTTLATGSTVSIYGR